jgi:hypothetical protein
MQRLARAHANCIEGLPVFGGLLGVAVMAGRSEATDALAFTRRQDHPVDDPPHFSERTCDQPEIYRLFRPDGDRRVLGVASVGLTGTRMLGKWRLAAPIPNVACLGKSPGCSPGNSNIERQQSGVSRPTPDR